LQPFNYEIKTCCGKKLEGCIFVIVAEQWIEDYVLKQNDRTRSLPLNINTALPIAHPLLKLALTFRSTLKYCPTPTPAISRPLEYI
jgi:hypothetical protein